MEEIIGLLFHARNVAHKEHLKTKSYAAHKALGNFYDEVIELADDLAEAYQGDEGIMADIPLFATTPLEPIDDFLVKQVNMIEKLRHSASSRSAVQNIIDSIIALYLSTIYKLRNLS
jgi:midasin (ATPase involved in ribosome maturation)